MVIKLVENLNCKSAYIDTKFSNLEKIKKINVQFRVFSALSYMYAISHHPVFLEYLKMVKGKMSSPDRI